MSMDPSQFRAPWYSETDLQKTADDFRVKCWSSDSFKLPVNVEEIAEFELDLHIIPEEGIFRRLETDACLLGDLSGIVVDRDEYMRPAMANRLRFSIAHELGHYILHPNHYATVGHTTVDSWVHFSASISDKAYSLIEWHANEFAGRLLVPPEPLKESLSLALSQAQALESGLVDMGGDAAKTYISSRIAKRFGVSAWVIQKRLSVEKLWPAGPCGGGR